MLSGDPCAIQWVLVGGYFFFFRLVRGEEEVGCSLSQIAECAEASPEVLAFPPQCR